MVSSFQVSGEASGGYGCVQLLACFFQLDVNYPVPGSPSPVRRYSVRCRNPATQLKTAYSRPDGSECRSWVTQGCSWGPVKTKRAACLAASKTASVSAAAAVLCPDRSHHLGVLLVAWIWALHVRVGRWCFISQVLPSLFSAKIGFLLFSESRREIEKERVCFFILYYPHGPDLEAREWFVFIVITECLLMFLSCVWQHSGNSSCWLDEVMK